MESETNKCRRALQTGKTISAGLETLEFTPRSCKSGNYKYFLAKCELRVANLAALLKNGRHLGFSIGQSGRFD